MNLKKRLLISIAAGALLCAILSFQTGCDKKPAAKPSAPPASEAKSGNPSAPPRTPRPQVTGTTELNPENDPAKRAIPVSKPAATPDQWALQALQDGYRKTGKTNAAWDGVVQQAFGSYAKIFAGLSTSFDSLKKANGTAQAAGCDDPMMEYLRIRYGTGSSEESYKVEDLIKAHDGIVRSEYHPFFKFVVGLRATESSQRADRQANRTRLHNWNAVCLEDTARDTNVPSEQMFDYARQWIETIHTKELYRMVTHDVLLIMERNWGKTEPWFVFRGKAEIRAAWNERGGGFAGKVTADGWQGFETRLKNAEGYLTKAWQMNSNRAVTAREMMSVELGQGQGFPRMDMWFKRAMKIDTNYYEAAKAMSYYLEPRWHGSEATCLAFARSCVSSPVWGGEVPLVLVETHRSLANIYGLSNAPVYWHRPQVWTDVKSSYEKFFKVCPDEVGRRHNYAYDAYYCGQYAEFLKQTKLFKQGTNHAFFGGREKFNAMLAKAAETARGSP